MKNGLYAAGAIALLLFGLLLWRFDPESANLFPPCPFRAATGLRCPGCGSQRAVHDLIHGHLAGAFRHNPLLVLAMPYLLLGGYMEYLGGKRRFFTLYRKLFGLWAIAIWGIGIVGFWVVRLICPECP